MRRGMFSQLCGFATERSCELRRATLVPTVSGKLTLASLGIQNLSMARRAHSVTAIGAVEWRVAAASSTANFAVRARAALAAHVVQFEWLQWVRLGADAWPQAGKEEQNNAVRHHRRSRLA